MRVPVQHEGVLAVVPRGAELSDALTTRGDQVNPVQPFQGRAKDLQDT